MAVIHPTKWGFPEKMRRARRAAFLSRETPSLQFGHTKFGGLHIRVLPQKLYPCAQRRDFLDAQCGSTELLQKSLVPRSPAKRNPEPHFPHGGSDAFCGCEARQRELPSKRSQGGTYNSDQKRMGQPRKNARSAPHFFRWLSLIIQFWHTKIGGLHIGSSPDFCSSLRIMYASLRFFLNFS